MRSMSSTSRFRSSIAGFWPIIASCSFMRVKRRAQVVADAGQHLGALRDLAADAGAHLVEGAARDLAHLGGAVEDELADIAALAEIIGGLRQALDRPHLAAHEQRRHGESSTSEVPTIHRKNT